MPKTASNRINFTKSGLNKLPVPPKGKRAQYYDTNPEGYGLYLEVSGSGHKSFCVRRIVTTEDKETKKVKSREVKVTIGAFPQMTIEQARSKLKNEYQRISAGIDPNKLKQDALNELTLGELFEKYISDHAKKARKTYTVMQKDFERNFGSWSKRKLSDITNRQVHELHQRISDERGSYAANRAIQLLRAVFYKGIAWGYHSSENPAKGITLFDETPRDRFLSATEAGKLLKALQSAPPEHSDMRTLRDFILLDMFTGVRKANLMAMEWKEIKGNLWIIPAAKTKGKKDQIIPLGENELAILEDRRKLLKKEKKLSHFVFPGNGKTGHLTDIKRSWTTLRDQLGLLDITIHDLRRSLAATMASQNVNVALIKGALNHKDMKTTLQVYARTTKQAELEAKQLAHAVWLEAADKAQDEKEKVTPIKRVKK